MLNKIKDNYGARRKYKRLGRGIGSGKGKTSARGGKGQTARSGVALNGFEGGQNPLYRRLPKRGFHNYNGVEFEVINLNDIQNLIDSNKVSSDSITIQNLKDIGLVKGKKALIKLLGFGKLNTKIAIEVNSISNKARDLLTETNSSVKIIEYTKPDSEKVAIKKANGKKAKRMAIAIEKRQLRQKQ